MKKIYFMFFIMLVMNVAYCYNDANAFFGLGSDKYSLTDEISIEKVDKQEDLAVLIKAVESGGQELGYTTYSSGSDVSWTKEYGVDDRDYLNIKIDFSSWDKLKVTIRASNSHRTAKELFDEANAKVLQKAKEAKHGIVAPTVKLPDYNTPEASFVAADWDVMASEFKDTLEGKYVYVDGVFYGMTMKAEMVKDVESAWAKTGLRNKVYFATFNLGNDKGKIATVGYPYMQREDGIHLIKLNAMDKIRVYGYIPPRSTKGGALRDGSYREKPFPTKSTGQHNCWPAYDEYQQCGNSFIWMIKVVTLAK